MHAPRHPISATGPRSSRHIVAGRLKGIPTHMAEAFVRAPLAFVVVAAFAMAMPIASAMGIRGAFGLALIVAVPLGIIGVAFQAEAYSNLRRRRGRRSTNLVALSVVSFCNMISVTAGIVALSPDTQGQAMIARSLKPIVAAAQQRAATLEAAADKYDALAQYSARKAAQEGAPAREWQPTCPSSTGPGPGPVTRWRIATGDEASAVAAGLKGAAQASRRAATDASRAASAYSYASHDQTMVTIDAAVRAINQAGAAIGDATSAALLDRIAVEIGASGICPDAPMAKLIAAAQAWGRGGPPAALVFTPPPKPSEEVSVRDLTSQLFARLLGGQPDLSMYLRYLWIAPLADLAFMFFLAQVLSPVRRDYRAEAAERLGVDPATADLIDAIAPHIAQDPEWRNLVGARQPVRTRLFAFDRILVDEDDWPRIYRMREYVASGGAREGGPNGDGHIVFILRPHFLDELWRQLLRRGLNDGHHYPHDTVTMLERE